MKVVSLFSGAGGLDLGFEQAGFVVAWANEYDKAIWATYRHNFPRTELDTRSIRQVPVEEIKEIVGEDVAGVIGGPPCQSWSEAGSLRGILDHRGQLFHEYIRILQGLRPKFFLAENVSGILFDRHREAVEAITEGFDQLGYILTQPTLLRASDYGVPQDRDRVFFVGLHRDWFREPFKFPEPIAERNTLRDAIWDLRESAVPAAPGNKANESLEVANHEYMTGGHSSIFMSRQRVRSWSEPSFTIQAGGRHAPLHPDAPKMECVQKDEFRFVPGREDAYRRLTVREAARVQTFPDTHEFVYKNIADGYKMVGNAVPAELARHIGASLSGHLKALESNQIISLAV
jgi:DNA (cytosine-5)-methyltransferase 1